MRSPTTGPDAATIETEFIEAAAAIRPSLYAAARRIVGDDEDAADVVQDSLVRAWRALPGFRGDATLSTWLHAIVVNRALSSVAQRRSRPTSSLDAASAKEVSDPHVDLDPFNTTQAWQLRGALLEAIAVLPDDARDVVGLRLQGLSHDEIATALGISAGTSRIRLHRARRRLRLALPGPDARDAAIDELCA